MGKKANTKKKRQPTKVSYRYKPENLSLEQWQITLRQQAAENENFTISEDKATDGPGYYTVSNPVTRNHYRVVFRGKKTSGTIVLVWISRQAVWEHASTLKP